MFIRLTLLIAISSYGYIAYALSQSVCTMEYAPVCGSVTVQCITTPCNPVRETFGNSCMANAQNATDVTQGECVTTPIVWGDSDEHGCKWSAGYTWDTSLAACVRPWEKQDMLIQWAYGSGLTRYSTPDAFGYDRRITRQEAAAIFARAGEKMFRLRYASYPDICNVAYTDESLFDTTLKNDIYSACAFDMMHGQDGRFSPNRSLSRAEAIAVLMRSVDDGRKDESGSLWYEQYAHRSHELHIITLTDPLVFDGDISRGELLEWLYSAAKYMDKKASITDENLLGDWKLLSYQLDDMMFVGNSYPLSFTVDRYSARFCNTINGSYSAKNGTLTSGPGMSTMMYCEGQSMQIEQAFSLDGATYAITSPRGTTLPSILLKITTKTGWVFTYTR